MKLLIYSVWMFPLPGCQLKSLTWAKEKQPSWWALVPAQSRNLSKIHPISRHKFHLDAFLHFIIAAPSPSTSIFSFDIWLHHGEAEEKETQARYFSGLFWSVVGVPPPDFLVLQDAIGPSQRAALSVPLALNRWDQVVRIEVPPPENSLSQWKNTHVKFEIHLQMVDVPLWLPC